MTLTQKMRATDCGCCEPEAAANAIHRRQQLKKLSPHDIEDIAYHFHCRVKWEDVPSESIE